MSAAAAGAGGARPALAPPPGALLRPRSTRELVPERGTGTASESPGALARRRLKENRLGQVAACLFLAMVVLCLSAPLLEKHWAGRTASEQNLSGTSPASSDKENAVVDLRGVPRVGPGLRREYTFGADQLGRDVFMRVLRGGAVSLLVGIGAAIITVVFGTLLGTAAGFFRGKIDLVISRMLDVLISVPSTVLAIAISTSLATSPGFWFIKRGSPALPLLIIGILGSFTFARVVRSKALELGGKEYVEAARALGAGSTRIMFREVIPHMVPTIVTWSGLLISTNIIAEAGLSFLGVGVLPPIPSWGNIIADGQIFYSTAWWIALFPGIFIVITVVTMNMVGTALEDALDPKGAR